MSVKIDASVTLTPCESVSHEDIMEGPHERFVREALGPAPGRAAHITFALVGIKRSGKSKVADSFLTVVRR